MEIHYHTQLKASKEFWQEQLTQQFIHTDSRVIEIDQGEISIESIDSNAEQDIIELSMQNPGYNLEAKYSGEDPYENLTATYQYEKGIRKFIKEEYEYCFKIRKEEWEKLDPEFYFKFQEAIGAYFKRIDNYRIRTSESDPTFLELPVRRMKQENLIHPTIAYKDEELTLTARKFGLTLLEIRIIEIKEYTTLEDSDENLEKMFDDLDECINNQIQ